MNLNNSFENFSKDYNAHKSNIDELINLEWLANLIGSEKCKSDIKKQLDAERKPLLNYFKNFIEYYKKSGNCVIDYASKLSFQEENDIENPKIMLKK